MAKVLLRSGHYWRINAMNHPCSQSNRNRPLTSDNKA
jgi:hypothetical protein